MPTNLDVQLLPITFAKLDGGLNTTSGPLGVGENESTDLQNIEFDMFGSILQRNGYTALNTTYCTSSGTAQGLYWYISSFDKYPIMVNHRKIYKMDALDGGWDDITGAVDLTGGGGDTETKLFLHCDGANGSTGFTDSSLSAHTITANGNAQLDTAQYKFGTASGLFDGTGDYLTAPDHADWYFGTGNFTIDFWVRFNDLTVQQCFVAQTSDTYNTWYIIKNSTINNNTLEMTFTLAGVHVGRYQMTNAWSVSTGTWYHLAFVRNGSTGLIFIDGVSQTVTETTAFAGNDVGDITDILRIGVINASQQNPLNGWLDEVRISKGIARWTSNFTPPTDSYGELVKYDFETFLGYVIASDGLNVPWQWKGGNSTATAMTVISGLTSAKFVKKFQNYLLMANVIISGVKYPSRFYWSTIRTIDSWSSLTWIEVSKDDGDEITGIKVLGDRLVVYKQNSIYIVIFTGNSDIPFIVQKSNSHVGCVAPYSIQEVTNGHVFVSTDGVYFFDGYNSYKISDKINNTFLGLNNLKFENAISMYQKTKNRYWLSVPNGTSDYNETILTWNSYLNAWSKYAGMSASTMAIFMVNGTEERPYFADYGGYVYRGDIGLDDYPANTLTAINAYYWTNWKSYGDICDKKGVPHVYITHRAESKTTLTFDYAYDFYNGSQYTQSFSLVTTQSVTAYTARRDLIGRGRFARFKFANSATTTSFRIDGIGTYITREAKS